MILSHRNKFIYIHVYKVAGTSIRTVLKEYDDRSDSDFPFYKNLQFYLGSRFPSLSKLAVDHINVTEIKRFLPENIFNTYFKFAFVRNPWDWQVSLYHYMLQYKNHPQHRLVSRMKSFDEYIEWRVTQDMGLQKDFLYDNKGNLLVNFIGRFENLQEDFNIACSKIPIKQVQLPLANKSNHKFYKEYYNKNTRDLIYNAFKEDIELFKYDF
jgi:hypothetical protein